MKYCFGIDIGGTTVKIGLFSEAGTILPRWEVPTRKGNDPAELLKDVQISLENCMQEKGMAKEDMPIEAQKAWATSSGIYRFLD